MNQRTPDPEVWQLRRKISLIQAERFSLSLIRLEKELISKGFNPAQPRDNNGRWSAGNDIASELRDKIDGASISNIAYQGEYHDVVQEFIVKTLRENGNTVITEVSLTLPGNPPVTARLDILFRNPVGEVRGIEIKTGDNPTFTPSQTVIYPHVILGAGIICYDSKIAILAITPGSPLPRIPIDRVYVQGPGARVDVQPITPERQKWYDWRFN